MPFFDAALLPIESELRKKITDAYRMDEDECIKNLLNIAASDRETKAAIKNKAFSLVEKMRSLENKKSGVESLMNKYDLSSDEGIALMCLAESLLRIPDVVTIDKLIEDKISKANWQSHLDRKESMFVNAATWGLMLTGKIYDLKDSSTKRWQNALNRFIKNSSDSVIRKALKHAMRLMGKQFVMGETIESALKRSQSGDYIQRYKFSFDMLGEAARTQSDANRYFSAYEHAIATIKEKQNIDPSPITSSGISVKLSALHPRYHFAQKAALFQELLPKLKFLAKQAKSANINFTIDAEEADRLDISLDLIEAILSDSDFANWEGFGLAVQAYQKRALPLLHWLAHISRFYDRKIMVRLVKGAYWDSEIKQAQELGLEGFPVFTRKQATDVSYLACAKFILTNTDVFYPQFATHNAYTVSAIMKFANEGQQFEFQRLHGMGETLYDDLVTNQEVNCRVYAPVGGHEHLLAYLVRRLLENGANTSFVNRINDKEAPIEELISCPVDKLLAKKSKAHPEIRLPRNLFSDRLNSIGYDLSNRQQVRKWQAEMLQVEEQELFARPEPYQILKSTNANSKQILNPSNKDQVVGKVIEADKDIVSQAITAAYNSFANWNAKCFLHRATILEKIADKYEAMQSELMAILVLEAGKTMPNAIAEVREAVDFCRYYACLAKKLANTQILQGPTGELNQLFYSGKGPIVCISPWNFPLAIFTGQIVAALVTGNTVLAKPAEQTPLIAAKAVKLMYEAGLPEEVLYLLPGEGEQVGAQLVADERIAGVMFTGSNLTANLIQKTLSAKSGAIVPFIAETGGQNCMIVDSSALLEQVVIDVLSSSFDSSGQRCSALRILLVQESIADDLIKMLKGAMAELRIGYSGLLATDIGPVIDNEAKQQLEEHIANMQANPKAKVLYSIEASSAAKQGYFVAPTLIEIEDITVLEREVFGPILHIMRYPNGALLDTISLVNSTGFGLTFGIHSRIESNIQLVAQKVKAGNLYVNRNMVGAVVGVQPFGGQGLSGTGPKAGGPHYLLRLVNEHSLSVNTTAFGGNASLLSLDDDADY